MTTEEFVTVEVWVLVDEAGNAVSDCLPEHLKDEYEADHGCELDPSTATRVVKIALRVPLPRPIELTGSVPAEPVAGSELVVVA